MFVRALSGETFCLSHYRLTRKYHLQSIKGGIRET